MEPTATFREAARILQPGGVFAANDYDWPPTTGAWEADAAYEACIATVRRHERELKLRDGLKEWEKDGHLARMRASGMFRHVKEVLLQHTDTGDAERLVGVLLSQGGVMSLLKRGLTESQLGIDVLRETARRVLGTAALPWHWSARVRMGVV